MKRPRRAAARLRALLCREDFPLAAKYDPEWVLANEMGPNVLWLTEVLCRRVALKPGMRVLDLGCGRAISSIFLAREFGVTVWATDLWISATDNWGRIRQAGLEWRVFPVHAEAHALPYAHEFFDAVLSVDAYHYFGTDDLYLRTLTRFLRPGGVLGIVVPGLAREMKRVPPHLAEGRGKRPRFWDPAECWSFHTARWWRRHWERTGLVDVERCEFLAGGGRLWQKWEEARRIAGRTFSGFPPEDDVLRADRGRWLGFIVAVARLSRSSSTTSGRRP